MERINKVLVRAAPEEDALMRVAIAGAGAVGRSIAAELLENGHEVLLIDIDPKAIKIDTVPRAEWLLADACEISSLDEAGLRNCHVVVAASGDDKVNLVVSLLAKTEYGVPRVVARINHPKNEWLFNESWGVDVAVSTPRLLSRAGRGGGQRRRPGPADDLPPGRRPTWSSSRCPRTRPWWASARLRCRGRSTRRWSRSCARAGCWCPAPTTRWRPGDELLFVATQEVEQELAATCCPRTDAAPRPRSGRVTGRRLAAGSVRVLVRRSPCSRTGLHPVGARRWLDRGTPRSGATPSRPSPRPGAASRARSWRCRARPPPRRPPVR